MRIYPPYWDYSWPIYWLFDMRLYMVLDFGYRYDLTWLNHFSWFKSWNHFLKVPDCFTNSIFSHYYHISNDNVSISHFVNILSKYQYSSMQYGHNINIGVFGKTYCDIFFIVQSQHLWSPTYCNIIFKPYNPVVFVFMAGRFTCMFCKSWCLI